MAAPLTSVWSRVVLPGFHHWPDAPPHRGYLADRHRHLFHIKVEVAVTHKDREVEFHDLSDRIREWWISEWGSASCEVIADTLAVNLRDILDGRSWCITVSEDGESGATLYYEVEE